MQSGGKGGQGKDLSLLSTYADPHSPPFCGTGSSLLALKGHTSTGGRLLHRVHCHCTHTRLPVSDTQETSVQMCGGLQDSRRHHYQPQKRQYQGEARWCAPVPCGGKQWTNIPIHSTLQLQKVKRFAGPGLSGGQMELSLPDWTLREKVCSASAVYHLYLPKPQWYGEALCAVKQQGSIHGTGRPALEGGGGGYAPPSQGCIGRGEVFPPTSRAPSLRRAIVCLTAMASMNGIRNR